MRTLGPLLLLAACHPDDGVRAIGGEPSMAVGELELWFRDDGSIDLLRADGTALLEHGFAAVRLDDPGDGPWVRTDQLEGHWTPGPIGATYFAEGGDLPDLTWTVEVDRDALRFDVSVANRTAGPITLAKASALKVEGPRGVLFQGTDPSSWRVLENGSFTIFDFVAEMRTGDDLVTGTGAIAPGAFDGESVSNWNHALMDLDSGAGWVAGAVSFEHSMPVVGLSAGSDGFSYLALEAAYLPAGKPLGLGESLRSERFWVDPETDDPVRGLERYAEQIAAENGIVPWHRRAPGRRVPNGWNSWSGGGSSGGLGTDIDQATMIANLDVMADELRDWGFDWFQLDDGYEPFYGDWQWRTDRFPDGPAWFAQQIRDRGLRPGLWMAPFTADPGSQLVADHPDWFATKGAVGQVVVGDTEILDLSHPEVQDWLRDLFTTFRNDWGYEWLKLDFGYLALFGEQLEQPDLTREEAWRQALTTIDEALGDDTFFLVVGLMGIHYDIVDSGRTTLDNMPVWEMQDELILNQQGFLPTVRTAGRRWFLQDRAWINHPDLLFFRQGNTEPGWAPLTQAESEAFASFVGLSGGIVKIGEPLVDLTGPQLNTIRTLVPTYGVAARPVDLFRREFPEIWHLDVHAPLDGVDETWDVVGLYHWGVNVDLEANPFASLDEPGPRVQEVVLDDLGIAGERVGYEFWSGEMIEVEGGKFSVMIDPHSARVVALRPKLDRPQFLGWNRQITMGGTLLESVRWERGTLTTRFPVVPGTTKAPFTWRIGFRVPEGFVLADIRTAGAAVSGLEWEQQGELLTIRFDAIELGTLDLSLQFD